MTPESIAFHVLGTRPLPSSYVSHDFRGELIVLGSGTSTGVPSIGCGCDVCQSGHPKNWRTRSSIILGLPEGNLLVDTTPDMRMQLLREKIGIVHAVLYTHEHADHIFGLDDLRLFPFYLDHAVPLFCQTTVEERIRKSFDYAFANVQQTHKGAVPRLEFETITHEPFSVLNTPIIPIPLKHGPRFDVLGFRIGNVAYCTDTNKIPDSSWPLLEGVETLIIGALRHKSHPTHFNIEQAVEVVQQLKPKQAYFTHLNHDLDHDTTNAELPGGIELAYDGLRIPLT